MKTFKQWSEEESEPMHYMDYLIAGMLFVVTFFAGGYFL